ncbi:biliverdin-producing heme oxygenase [Salinarimonas soli]|uniref:Biliverdin-producing heme oxygenase n=1 Tax=Salinarimonas soli TaxID=1638099 RepID=A0A5B2VDD6_9HYPH|nr:biliverdin-producing heme oxygenase [Salinarimonas soli]KAA2236107.1 biliverdin-producing heme oxygenase [Salinarimonas soli]
MPALESLSPNPTLAPAPYPHGRSPERLSLALRAGTGAAHEAVEHATGLPGSVATLAEYRACLAGFARVIGPLEQSLRAVPGFAAYGICLDERARMPALRADLRHLGIDADALAPVSPPRLGDLAAGLGALYVVEGSVLGGRVILDALSGRLGDEIAAAAAFFGGRGPRTGLLWQTFRAALDRFGEDHPGRASDVIAGAERTFDAFTAAFRAHPIAGGQP